MLLIVTLMILAVSTVAQAASPPPHAAITITSDSDFVSCACVASGSGTAADPFVIGPWKITAPSSGGWALKVDNSRGRVTKFFNVAGIVVEYNDTDPTHPVVWLVEVTNPTTIENVVANSAGIGVRLTSSANIALDGIEVNRMNGDGVLVESSSHISIVDSKLKSMMNGFHAENSSFIEIGAGCETFCNDFTYDERRGLWLHNTHDVIVRWLITSAEDTTAMLLDGRDTYNVDIGFSEANASGSICAVGRGGPTGLVTDTQGGIRLVNGAHDNFIHDVSAHGNVAMDIASGGDGFWDNPCNPFERVIISPATARMGPRNRFERICYSVTNIPNLPPSTCPDD
ncbi:MAG: right-handed parallel beta-helix repeat-containing protein [Chloroflexi bacterium]|nr:right-handed parallel beta-helix repeat-containing protein [Chloroflexota bacterium]